MADLDSIQKKIISFRNERDWAQFHDPKNLAEALSIEAGNSSRIFFGRLPGSPAISRLKTLSLEG